MLDPWLPIEHHSKTDQTLGMLRLIGVFDGHTCLLVPFAGHLLRCGWLREDVVGINFFDLRYSDLQDKDCSY